MQWSAPVSADIAAVPHPHSPSSKAPVGEVEGHVRLTHQHHPWMMMHRQHAQALLQVHRPVCRCRWEPRPRCPDQEDLHHHRRPRSRHHHRQVRPHQMPQALCHHLHSECRCHCFCHREDPPHLCGGHPSLHGQPRRGLRGGHATKKHWCCHCAGLPGTNTKMFSWCYHFDSGRNCYPAPLSCRAHRPPGGAHP